MAWYDLHNETETRKDYLARVKYDNIVCKRANNFMEIVGNELLPKTQYRIITQLGFNAISVVEFLLKKHTITEIYMAVYRMNIQSVRRLKKIIESGDIKCSIILSSFFRENKKYERWSKEILTLSKQNEKVKMNFAWCHAKVFLAKTKDGKHIVFEDSGNLSDNARIEQYIIEDNVDTYNFHKKWISEILNENGN